MLLWTRSSSYRCCVFCWQFNNYSKCIPDSFI